MSVGIEYITALPIYDHLLTLDYIDIRHLSHTCKALQYVCRNNTLLRYILYKNSHMYIEPDFNIAKSLYQLYAEIDKLITSQYKLPAPRFINKELMLDDIKRKMYIATYEQIYHEMQGEECKNIKDHYFDVGCSDIAIPWATDVIIHDIRHIENILNGKYGISKYGIPQGEYGELDIFIHKPPSLLPYINNTLDHVRNLCLKEAQLQQLVKDLLFMY